MEQQGRGVATDRQRTYILRNVRPLPGAVSRVVNEYYANPVKIAADQTTHDLRLASPTLGEARVLAELVLAVSANASLEIGLGVAGSTISIAAAKKYLGRGAKHVALDPYQVERSSSIGLSEIAKCGLEDQVYWLPQRSEVFLQAAGARGEKYDFIFVDGGHTIGQTVVDAYYVDPILRSRGVVVFHDGLLFSTAAAVKYLRDELGYELLRLPKDSLWKTAGRSLKYVARLGVSYVKTVVPCMHGSLVALQRSA